MSIATAAGTYVSSYFLLPVKMKEETAKRAIERKAKGAELHCEKLQLAAALGAEIVFAADKGFVGRPLSDGELLGEQLALEKRAIDLIPFLSEQEGDILKMVSLHHFTITQMRTSKVPVAQRVPSSRGGFDANSELAGIRNGAANLSFVYRSQCTEGP